MTNKYSITSNEVKLYKHLHNLQGIQNKMSTPVMFHISPTNKCNMKCGHCCFSGRDKILELDYEVLKQALKDIRSIGCKAIEWTGGGEPTLYPYLAEATKFAHDIGLKIGMNTNAINYNDKLDYSMFNWVRVSLNVFDLGIDLDKWMDNVKKIQTQTKVSACYIHSSSSNNTILRKICEFAIDNKIYTRLAPDCIQRKHEIEIEIKDMKNRLEMIGHLDNEYIMISDFNVYLGERPSNICMMHVLKPFLYTDGWVYACPSSELAIENNRTMQEKFRVCPADDIFKYYNEMFEVKHFDCSYCKYANQNNILWSLIQEVDDVEFC